MWISNYKVNLCPPIHSHVSSDKKGNRKLQLKVIFKTSNTEFLVVLQGIREYYYASFTDSKLCEPD